VLTVSEVGHDGVYALVDHVCLAQRVGALPWLGPAQVDLLDRFVEVFWLNETLSVICRELYTCFRSRSSFPPADRCKSSARRRAASPASSGDGSATPTRRRQTMSDRLLSPMVSYPSVASIGSMGNDTKGDGGHVQGNGQDLSPHQVAKRKMSVLLLFKAAICDLPCCLYFLRAAEWRNRGRNKAWCGLLGMLSSLVALHINWPSLLPPGLAALAVRSSQWDCSEASGMRWRENEKQQTTSARARRGRGSQNTQTLSWYCLSAACCFAWRLHPRCAEPHSYTAHRIEATLVRIQLGRAQHAARAAPTRCEGSFPQRPRGGARPAAEPAPVAPTRLPTAPGTRTRRFCSTPRPPGVSNPCLRSGRAPYRQILDETSEHVQT
ncbi:unnamed protein product, partial [Prorocentrum cordatum]